MTALRRRRGSGLLAPARARERSVRLRVGITWGLLVLNGLTYYGSLVHIPTAAGRVVQQGALQVALLVALTVNRRVTVRPNVFLCLASLLVIGAMVRACQLSILVASTGFSGWLSSLPCSGFLRHGGVGATCYSSDAIWHLSMSY